LTRRLLIALAIFVVAFIGFSIYADVSKLTAVMRHYKWWTFGAAIGLTSLNYAIRFVRWQEFLRIAKIDISARDSGSIFLSGFVMSITPGKVGEVLKSFLLRERHGVPVARSAPIVVAERLTDLVAVLLIAAVGVGAYHYGLPIVIAAGAMVGLGLAILSSRRASLWLLHAIARIPGLRRLAHKVEEFYDGLAELVRPGALFKGSALSLVAWACECLGFWFILTGFGADETPRAWAAFIYATTTLAGAISFLPGGLVATEVSMTALLMRGATGFDKATAVAATILCRLATLWFGVLVGMIALGLRRRRRPA
jgi:glycosyltransferase 2 family protein